MAPQLRDHDRYDILGEHGRGGLGRVSRVHDRELGRDIAIKELISRGALSEVRFLREALITARLEHPGIVPVYEAGRWADGTPFYAMKLVSGRPLRDLIAERKTVDERLALLHHVITVADAIAYAHVQNIIHRDLKPSNVIVGDFGETVVIDWGLAKDLTSAEEPAAGGGPFREHRDDGLTSAGTVLGTPAYMAPEQARGEPVDQRADVFAIGAMLWELCSLQKLPPGFSGQRRRILRKSGIDPDLVTIIEKALDPDPLRRYPDAGALAADLKAFKAGARIAARRYPPWALLVHWTRRHRPMAITMATGLSILIAGAVLYVRDVADQRDRADASEDVARRSQRSAQASLDDLTLKHAELLLSTDPSAAIDALVTYRGDKREHAELIRAKAAGMGVALLRAKPHTDNVRWVTGTQAGAIISLSTDGTIVKTSPDKSSTVLTRGVSSKGRAAYAPSRGLLVYDCDPADLCIWDVRHDVRIPPAPAFRGWQLARVAFSPDETKLALFSYSGLLRVFEVSDPGRPIELLHVQRDHGIGLLFVDDETIAVGLSDDLGALEIIHLDGSTQTLTVHENFLWDTNPKAHRLVLATEHGVGIYLSHSPLRVLHRVPLCHDTPASLKFLPDRHAAAYACREGTIGIWDTESQIITPLMHMEGHVDAITVDDAHEYLIATGGNGTLAVIDLETNLISYYRGHEFRITSIALPTPQYPYIISADIRGAVRVWPLPSRVARVSGNLHTRFISAIFDNTANAFIATTFRTELTVSSKSDVSLSISPHLGRATLLEMADDGSAFAAYGSGESIEIWNARTLSREQLINTHQGAVSRVTFTGNTGDFITGGRDGRLIKWAASGEEQQTISIGTPITNLIVTHDEQSDEQSIVVSTSEGALWRVTPAGQVSRLHDAGAQIVRMISVPKIAAIVVAYSNGDVTIFNTNSWECRVIFHASQAVRDVAITADGRSIAVVDSQDVVHVTHQADARWFSQQPAWTPFAVRARIISFTPDGLLLALCSDSTLWFYSIESRRWYCMLTGTADLNAIATSARSERAAVFDSDGHIILVDLQTIKKTLKEIHQGTTL